MDFRRIPFQFSTTDASKRQEELQRRFGLPANKGNMYVDFANSGAMGTRSDNSSASNSPRLQHRVPIFVEGLSEPTKPSVDAQNVDCGRKPHVRVIPIEIEGEDSASKRHRWLSGSSDPIKERVNGTSIPVETIKYPVQAPSPQSPKAPRVCNIPIKIEGTADVIQPKLPVKTQKAKTPESPKNTGVKLNGFNAKVGEKRESPTVTEKKASSGREEVTLKKIKDILEKLNGYHTDVEKFSGTNKEKSYRYLDEMLTRCMLELDEIDTLGLDTIRLARKAAVKKVQASIDLLESKVIKEEKGQDQVSKEPMEIESAADQPSEDVAVNVEATNDKSEVAMDSQETAEAVSAQVEVTTILPEQISEKVENISIMETEEAVLKPEKKSDFDQSANESSEKMNVEVTEPVQITEIEVGADVVTSEIEPIIEEPSSDSKGENVDMDQSSCNCDSDLKLDKPSVEICEVESNVFLDANKPSDVNLEMEITEASDIPIVSEQTVLSNDIQAIVDTAEQSVSCNDLIECANVSDSSIPT